MNAKSRIFWEIPRNTLIWPKSAEIGVIDVKYIYFPYISGPKCWRQSVFGQNITLKISNTLGDAQEYPNLAKISRKGGYWCEVHLFSLSYRSKRLAPISIWPKHYPQISNILGDAQEYPTLTKISRNESYGWEIHLFSFSPRSKTLAPINWDPKKAIKRPEYIFRWIPASL